MMIKLLISIFILLNYLSISMAQDVKLGIRTDFNTIYSNNSYFSSKSDKRFFNSLHINGVIYLTNELAGDLREGYIRMDHYSGSETGLLLRYYYKDLYGITGLIYHHVRNNADNSNWDGTLLETDLFMPALGLGFNPGGNFAIEVMYQHGLYQVVGYKNSNLDNLFPRVEQHTSQVKLTHVIKVGFGYLIDL